jgi:ubiquinone biosynthesis protein
MDGPSGRTPVAASPPLPPRRRATPSAVGTAWLRSGIPQASALAGCVGRIALALAVGRLGDLVRPAATRRRRQVQRRRRAVEHAVATLGALKGAFAKAGQFAALRHDLLSRDAIAAFARLRDRVPPLPFPAIQAAVEASLGAPLAQLFAEFDPEPLGAASLAQAHRARLFSGQPVVVKVQYPWLRASLPADLAVLRVAAALLSGGRDRSGRRRAFGEFAAAVEGELDFLAEAASAREIAANLAGDPAVVVPAPVASHTTKEVLTVAWHPAVPVNDAAALAERGIDPAAVIAVVARAYAKQIFIDGLFHADPHPGNLGVIDEPEAARRPRVLFIDFGLCRRLDPRLRREMRLGLYALLQRDVDAFVARMDAMGMIAPGAGGEVRAAVAHMFERIAAEGGGLGSGGATILALKGEAVALLQRTRGIVLPTELLLYARTLATVFSLAEEVAPRADVMKLTLPYLLQFLAKAE